MSPDTRIKVRCSYDTMLATAFDATVHHAVGRESDFSGVDCINSMRELGWSCKDEAEANELRRRLATCPEVTVQ